MLIIQNKRIGDVLLSSIIATNIKNNVENCTIHFFCYDYAAAVLENNSNIDKIITVGAAELKKIPILLKYCRQIRKEQYDLIIDPYSKFQSKLMCFLSGAPKRVGNVRHGKRMFWKPYTHPVQFQKQALLPCGKSIEDRVALVDAVVPLHKKYYEPKIELTPEELNYKLPAGSLYIMITVLGSVPSKSLPATTMAALIDRIAQHYEQHTILFNYAPNQRLEARKIYELCEQKSRINMDLYESDLRKFLSALNKCELLIANEGGSVHMAKAISKPTFTIYSPFIKKESWNSFENMDIHESIHLKDFEPELYKDSSRAFLKTIEKEPLAYYKQLSVDMIWGRLQPYLQKNL